MAEVLAQSGEFRFSVDSSLLFELGERLVTKPSIALAELVKNAYDADATKVSVTFENVSKSDGSGVIIIEDNGHGMTFEELQSRWMRIATSEKRDKPLSRIYCRPLSGAKGIGRLAARRLGSKLLLQSIAVREDEGICTKESVVVNFDWKEDFSPGEDLVGIPISYTRQQVSLSNKTGVALFIEGVRDRWTKDDINNLRRDLLSLQNPYPDILVKSKRVASEGCLPDPGFSFELIIEGSEELRGLSGDLGETFLQSAWAKLEGKIDENGRACYYIILQRTGEKDNLIDDSNDYSGLEEAGFRIYFFIYRKEFFLGSSIGLQAAQRKGRVEGGVRIYLDGFRVFPYGDPGNDWLQLEEYNAKNLDLATLISPPEIVTRLAKDLTKSSDDAKRFRPFLLIPKNNQLFGAVAISQAKHSNIEINVTRNSLLETSAVTKLQRFVQNGIYWMTMKYAALVAEERSIQRREKAQTVPDIIEETRISLANETEIPEERRQALLENLDRAFEQAKEEHEDHISEISMLNVLASAGTTLALMNHQLQALVGGIFLLEQDLLRLKPNIPANISIEYDDIILQISEWREMIELQTSQLGFLLSPDSRQRRRRHVLYQIVENVRKPMSYYMKRYGVTFENNVPRDLRTPPIYQSELYAVLINILSNALKAVYNQADRRIIVDATKRNNAVSFWMCDTGVGVPIERREISFKPFISTSLPNPVLGVGTGLGLMVVRDILDAYDGTARFIDAESPWKTCIEIILPERDAVNGN